MHLVEHRYITHSCIWYLLAFITLASSAYAEVEFVGTAFHESNSTLLYREIHCGLKEPSSIRRVIYTDRNNKIFAYKEILDSSTKPISHDPFPSTFNKDWIPEYNFTHLNSGFLESLTYEKSSILLSTKESKNTKAKRSKLRIPSEDDQNPMIADAGFDRFILDNIESLIEGNSIKVNYLSAPRLAEISFLIQLSDSNKETLTFTLQPTNMIVRFLLGPIRVTYERNPARLIRFEGITNIPRTRNKNFSATIQYQYDMAKLKDENLNELCQ